MSELEFNKIFSRNLNTLLQQNGKTQAELAEYLGVSTASVSHWCNGLKSPRMDKIDKMCTYFGIKRSDLMEDKTVPAASGYYLDEETRNMAQFMFENPNYKVLFDATRKVKPEDIDFVKQMIDRFSRD